jgi:glyoxylase I family protein
MERVTGIGGFFFAASDPDALSQWYATHLGVDPIPRSHEESPWQQEEGPTAFTGMPAGSEALGRPGAAWAINFRVRDLNAMTTQLEAAGISVQRDPEHYPIGFFASLQDPEGNSIQLWQPENRER